jgi:hypothetical protein
MRTSISLHTRYSSNQDPAGFMLERSKAFHTNSNLHMFRRHSHTLSTHRLASGDILHHIKGHRTNHEPRNLNAHAMQSIRYDRALRPAIDCETFRIHHCHFVSRQNICFQKQIVIVNDKEDHARRAKMLWTRERHTSTRVHLWVIHQPGNAFDLLPGLLFR